MTSSENDTHMLTNWAVESNTIVALGLGFGLRPFLEFLRERLVVEEDPGVIKLAVPCPFQITNRRDELIQLFIAHEGDEGGIRTGGVGIVGRIVVTFGSP